MHMILPHAHMWLRTPSSVAAPASSRAPAPPPHDVRNKTPADARMSCANEYDGWHTLESMAEVLIAEGWLRHGHGSSSSFRGPCCVSHTSAICASQASRTWQHMFCMRRLWWKQRIPKVTGAGSQERAHEWGTVPLPSCKGQNYKRRKLTKHKTSYMLETNNVIINFGMNLELKTAVPLL